MKRDQREAALNDATRRLLVAENYDSHFATLENRILVEDRLFLARWDALCSFYHVNPETLLQPRWRNTARGIVYTELARGEYLSNEPAGRGAVLIVYRDEAGHTWVRSRQEMDDGRYDRL